MRLLLLLLLLLDLSPALAAQKWSDEDYKFSFELPPGMRKVPAEELVQRFGFAEEVVSNPPRPASETTKIAHYHLWLEEFGQDVYRRQIDLRLVDEIPFGGRDDLRQYLVDQGLEIVNERDLPMPLQGLRIEGTFNRPDGVTMRQWCVFLSRQGRYALLTMQAHDADWPIVRPQFAAALESVRFRELMNRPPERPDPFLRRGAGSETEGWDSLRVAGSLALGAALIVAMVLQGGRGRAA